MSQARAYQLLDVASIKPDPNQPRKVCDPELVRNMAETMKTQGVINPIEVTKEGIIVTGETRWRAAKLAGLKKMPGFVVGKSDKLRQIIENVQRKDLNAVELGEALLEMKKELGLSNRKLGKSLGKSEAFVSNYVVLVKDEFPKALREAVRKNEVNADIARTVYYGNDKEVRDWLMEAAMSQKIKDERLCRNAKKYLYLTKDFKGADEVLKKNTTIKATELFKKKCEEVSVPEQLNKNLKPGQQLASAMTTTAMLLNDTNLKEIPAIQIGRLVVSYTTLKRQMTRFSKQLNSPEVKKIRQKK